MKRNIALTLSLIVLLCSLSCSSNPNRAEAERMARNWWNAAVTKCGDSYYMNGTYVNSAGINTTRRNVLYHFRTSNFSVTETPLTQADRLNGIEWQGVVEIPVSAYRYYDYQERSWYGWFNGQPPRREGAVYLSDIPPTLGTSIVKRRGRWDIGSGYRKPSCSEIPRG